MNASTFPCWQSVDLVDILDIKQCAKVVFTFATSAPKEKAMMIVFLKVKMFTSGLVTCSERRVFHDASVILAEKIKIPFIFFSSFFCVWISSFHSIKIKKI